MSLMKLADYGGVDRVCVEPNMRPQLGSNPAPHEIEAAERERGILPDPDHTWEKRIETLRQAENAEFDARLKESGRRRDEQLKDVATSAARAASQIDWAGASRADAAWRSFLLTVVTRWPLQLLFWFSCATAAMLFGRQTIEHVPVGMWGYAMAGIAIGLALWYTVRNFNPLALLPPTAISEPLFYREPAAVFVLALVVVLAAVVGRFTRRFADRFWLKNPPSP